MLEYKFFEPAFYHTDVPDWGTSYAQVAQLGDQALVCLDTGHHAPGTNIEFIVAQLLRLGSSARSTSTRASTPTTTSSSVQPTRSSCSGSSTRSSVAAASRRLAGRVLLDQCHNVEDKIPGQIRSVLNVQEMTARALLVDRDALTAAQEAGDVLGANGILMDAFYTDVRGPLAAWRECRGLPADPFGAYLASGYQQQIAEERVGGTQASWGA